MWASKNLTSGGGRCWPFYKLTGFALVPFNFQGMLIVESNLSNVVSCVSPLDKGPRRFHFYFK